MWGFVRVAGGDGQRVRPRTEGQLAELTELVSSAIANALARDDLQRLAREQEALRRVATLIAEQAPATVVFDAVAVEAGRALNLARIGVYRYNADGSATVLATTLAPGFGRVGSQWSLDGPSVLAAILRTGRPARIDDFNEATGTIAAEHRSVGYGNAAGAPIQIGGSLWGAVVAGATTPDPFPPRVEHRIAAFTQLLATAIANVQARADLAASRARIVAAADEERRRMVRDLHDGAQQRLAQTIVTLKLARRALQDGRQDAPELVNDALQHAETATHELRELVHGILPSILTLGGLTAGVGALTAHMSIPVEVDISVDRLPGLVEATAYFVVAEALTNVAKHAQAQHATVHADLHDHVLHVVVRDDGIGGARPDGNGLLGLSDRLAALDGTLHVESPAGSGTLIAASIPVRPVAPRMPGVRARGV